MLWTIFVVLLILWLLGFSFHVAGSLIHLLLVVALVMLVINLVFAAQNGLGAGQCKRRQHEIAHLITPWGRGCLSSTSTIE